MHSFLHSLKDRPYQSDTYSPCELLGKINDDRMKLHALKVCSVPYRVFTLHRESASRQNNPYVHRYRQLRHPMVSQARCSTATDAKPAHFVTNVSRRPTRAGDGLVYGILFQEEAIQVLWKGQQDVGGCYGV